MSINNKSHQIISNILEVYEKLKLEPIYETMAFDEEKNAIATLAESVKKNKFKIAVIGEFSVGKSTMINSFLQKDILPAKYRPTTNQITKIKHSTVEYVRIEDAIETTTELSKENVSSLNATSEKNIEIGVDLKQLQDYEILDTPGVNDPSMFSDEIVFDLIGEVDIVLFVMHASQVFKQSEITFLTKLIRQKDIGKFFFIINQSDIVGDEKEQVYNDFLEKASAYMNLNKGRLEKQTFLYSAKEALAAGMTNNNAELQKSGQSQIIESIDAYIMDHAQELLVERIQNETSIIVQNSLRKLETTLDILDDKDLEYKKTLNEIQKEMASFEEEIYDSTKVFQREFDLAKEQFKRDLERSFAQIEQEISAEIQSADIATLTEGRYIEIRTKKLVEDAVDLHQQQFLEVLQTNFQSLDQQIKPVFQEKNIVINNMINRNISSKVVKGLAVGGAVVGIANYGSSILAVGAVGTVVTAASSIAAIIPGPYALIAGTVGHMTSTAGTFLFDLAKNGMALAKWGVDAISSAASKMEENLVRQKYQTNVSTSLARIRNSVLSNIQNGYDSRNYLDAYIYEKFPQKIEIEERQAQAQKEFRETVKNNKINKIEIETIKITLESLV